MPDLNGGVVVGIIPVTRGELNGVAAQGDNSGIIPVTRGELGALPTDIPLFRIIPVTRGEPALCQFEL